MTENNIKKSFDYRYPLYLFEGIFPFVMACMLFYFSVRDVNLIVEQIGIFVTITLILSACVVLIIGCWNLLQFKNARIVITDKEIISYDIWGRQKTVCSLNQISVCIYNPFGGIYGQYQVHTDCGVITFTNRINRMRSYEVEDYINNKLYSDEKSELLS